MRNSTLIKVLSWFMVVIGVFAIYDGLFGSRDGYALAGGVLFVLQPLLVLSLIKSVRTQQGLTAKQD